MTLISQFLPAIHFLNLLRQVLELSDFLAAILVFDAFCPRH